MPLFFDIQLGAYPVQDGRDQIIIELAADGHAMSHARDFEISGASRVRLIHDLRDGLIIRTAHDVVAGTTDHQNRNVSLLPDFAEVQRLQLSIGVLL